MQEFINKHGLTSIALEMNERPDGLMGDAGSHWLVVIYNGKRSETFFFSQGKAFDGVKPDFDDVLGCLHMDCTMTFQYGADDVWDFFDDNGIEPTRENAKGFDEMRNNAEKLKRLLGSRVYYEFTNLEETD